MGSFKIGWGWVIAVVFFNGLLFFSFSSFSVLCIVYTSFILGFSSFGLLIKIYLLIEEVPNTFGILWGVR